jgi:hypothetical protein
MRQNRLQNRDYVKSEIENMTAMSIYMLMEQKGADVFGLWSANKSDILKSYGKQIGFKQA